MRKLLIITPRFPYPLEKGDKLRIYYQLRELAATYTICLVALTEEEVAPKDYDEIKKYCSDIYIFERSKWTIFKNLLLSFFKKRPLQVSYFYDKKIHRQILTIIKNEQPDHIYCQLIRTAAYVKGVAIPKTIDYMDTFSIGAKRWANHANLFIKPFLKREARLVSKYEARVYDWFDHHTIISEQDKNLLQLQDNTAITVIPNGVDTNFFAPLDGIEKAYDIVFVGNMGYKPNIEAAIFLVKDILPALLTRYPDFKILIAGARPSQAVQKLASDHVTVSGWVEDIRTAYASGSMFVAPLFLGSGQQNKILEAMAMGIPCITTDLVNNAIGAAPNQEILIANTTEEFIKQIIFLKKSAETQKILQLRGLAFIKDNFSWKAFVNQLNILFKKN